MFDFLKKKPKGTILEIAIDGMHCTSCSMNIDGELEDLAGVISAATSYAKQKTIVEYDPAVVTQESIKKVITDLGYTTK